MPTVKELSGIVDSSIPDHGPTINTDYFPNTQSSFYWSSNSYVFVPEGAAWGVYFYNGGFHISNMPYKACVRAVRGGQSNNNFIDNDNGTVTDTDTVLMWEKECAPGTYTWHQALSYCDNLTLSGYNDWRLPNRNELQSIVDYTRYHPSIDPIFADTVSYAYWSSTTIPYPESASNVSFYYGSGTWYGKTSRAYVRAVRGGQCGGN